MKFTHHMAWIPHPSGLWIVRIGSSVSRQNIIQTNLSTVVVMLITHLSSCTWVDLTYSPQFYSSTDSDSSFSQSWCLSCLSAPVFPLQVNLPLTLTGDEFVVEKPAFSHQCQSTEGNKAEHWFTPVAWPCLFIFHHQTPWFKPVPVAWPCPFIFHHQPPSFKPVPVAWPYPFIFHHQTLWFKPVPLTSSFHLPPPNPLI